MTSVVQGDTEKTRRETSQRDEVSQASSPLAPCSSPRKRPHFRFEDLEIWQLARCLAVKLHKLAEELDKKRLYRYAEQLRAAGLSLTNNIAESSGSTHSREFQQFLNVARRSLFEDTS